MDTGIKCDECGSPMNIKHSSRGPFLGYTLCKLPQHQTVAAGDEGKAQGGRRRMPCQEKEHRHRCPEQHHLPGMRRADEVRPGRWGKFFFRCAKYPKCKGIRQASPEIVEQLQNAVAPT